jgi:hypothetical protein
MKIQTLIEHDVKHTELKNAQMLSAQKNNIDCFLEKYMWLLRRNHGC